jgi:hypothetical protein
MKLTYPGPFEGVTVLATGQKAKRGTPIEIPDDIAASLLDQGWEPVKAPKPASKSTTTKAVKADTKENV